MRTKIKEILAAKGHNVWALPPQTTVYAAIEMMAEKGGGALAVTLAENLEGMVSELA